MGETCTQLSMLFNALTVPFSHVYSILYDSYSYYDDAAENYTSPLTRLKQRSEQIGENEFFFFNLFTEGERTRDIKDARAFGTFTSRQFYLQLRIPRCREAIESKKASLCTK